MPEIFISMVRWCISSTSFQVLWNGEALEKLIPSRGVRQGDPISPYLFVLCIERIFHLINYDVKEKMWKSIQLSRSAPKLSHLAFANDLLQFRRSYCGTI